MSIMHEKVCGKGTYGCLKCVHHEGYAHGDVRCSNIIFSKSVVFFLINFELVRHLPDVYPHRMSVETTLHCRNSLLGLRGAAYCQIVIKSRDWDVYRCTSQKLHPDSLM